MCFIPRKIRYSFFLSNFTFTFDTWNMNLSETIAKKPQTNTKWIKRRSYPISCDSINPGCSPDVAPNQQQQRESINIFLRLSFCTEIQMTTIQSQIYSDCIPIYPYLNLDLNATMKAFLLRLPSLTWGFISLPHLMEDVGLCLIQRLLRTPCCPCLDLLLPPDSAAGVFGFRTDVSLLILSVILSSLFYGWQRDGCLVSLTDPQQRCNCI